MTLQPVRRHDVDAAVMFADIMLPLLGMGVNVELVENVGPVIEQPIRSLADVERLTVPEPEESVPFILEAVSIVRRELRPDQAVIGFCGGQFTVDGHLIEGKPSSAFLNVKLGPIEFSVSDKETVNVPVWVGIGAIVVGGLLLVFGNKKS